VENLPGGKISSRPLHFIWILDCSGSMGVDGKIGQLNFAIHEAIPAMRDAAAENPQADVLARAVTFSTGARWHVATPTAINDFAWNDLTANGVTDLGEALELVAEQLHMPPMSERALPPVLTLISDGMPTDNFEAGLAKLMNEPWGRKAVRIAIAIGRDADIGTLEKFVDNPEYPILRADNAPTLIQYIRWASTAVLKAASAPASRPQDFGNGEAAHVPLPMAPPAVVDAGSVW
jgi:uncharacterized protein YegL